MSNFRWYRRLRGGRWATVTGFILVNVWGTVCEHDVCKPHQKKYHGILTDEFPARRESGWRDGRPDVAAVVTAAIDEAG